MNNKVPNIPALTRRFILLSISDLAFRQCKALAEHIIDEHLDAFSLLFAPQMAGVVVTYSKNFVSAEGFGPLQKPFTIFTDGEIQNAHDKLLHARHKLYAHRDAPAAQSFAYDDPSPIPPYRVRVAFRKGESGFTAIPAVPELNPTILPSVVRLCDLQTDRVREELNQIVPLMTRGKNYQAGFYTVGNDFP